MTALPTDWYWVITVSQWVMMMESVSSAQTVRGCRWYWWIGAQLNWRQQNSRLSFPPLMIRDISLAAGDWWWWLVWSEDKLIRLACSAVSWGPWAGSSVRTDYYISVSQHSSTAICRSSRDTNKNVGRNTGGRRVILLDSRWFRMVWSVVVSCMLLPCYHFRAF